MMRNGYLKKWIKATAYLLAASLMLGQSMVSMATEEKAQATEAIKYITDIYDLAEEDIYLVYESSPSLEELQSVFPETLTVTLKDETDTAKVEVTWECETDYESDQVKNVRGTYTFIPKWDESVYVLSKEIAETVEIPVIIVETLGKEISLPIKDLEKARKDLQAITEQKSVLALVYLCSQYEVKESPAKDGNTVITVVSGQSVQIEDVKTDKDGNVWYKVLLYQKENAYNGYIEKKYLATSDEDFLEWAEKYIAEETVSANRPVTMSIMSLSTYEDVNQFPTSYQNKLLSLKQKYPNWIFVKMETGLNFNTAVTQEMKEDRSWISSSKPASWQNGKAVQTGWSYASEGILRYYMDPRNFLTESNIFQFEQLTYNESYHTKSAVQAIVANSFMSGDIPGEGMTYAGAFTEIGQELKISSFHLASRVLQEQGTKGTSELISGTYPGYEGYYNYFNVGANGSDEVLIKNGLAKAKEKGWNSRYKSLRGGAAVIGESYILRGQDTLYLQKFNVTSNNTYNHQYMQNILAPSSEAPNIMKAYNATGALDNSFVFKIPVYSNMPASACPQPDTKDKLTLNKSAISSLAVDKTEKLIPYVNDSMVDSLTGITFSSNNTDVATVDAQGVVKAISPGTATITCARSNANSTTCTVTVVKAEPVVDTPIINPVVYEPGLKLSNISLPERWNWQNQDTPLNAGTTYHTAVYTPSDTTKYLSVSRTVSVKVTPAYRSCEVPKNLTAKLGSKLGSIALPDEFAWESDEETILDKAGEQEFYLTYIPNDKNYCVIEHIVVIVKVVDDNTEPENPDDQGDSLPGSSSGTTSSGSTGNNGTTGSGGTGGSGSGSTGSGTNSGTGGSGGGNSGSNNAGSNGSGNDGNSSRGSSGTNSGTGGSGSGNGTGDSGGNSGGSSASGSGNTGSSGTTSSNGTTSSGSTGTTGSGSTGNSGTTGSGNTGSSGTTSGGSTGSSSAGNSGTTGSGSVGSSGTTGSGSTGGSGTTGSGSTGNSSNTGGATPNNGGSAQGNNNSTSGGNNGNEQNTDHETVNHETSNNGGAVSNVEVVNKGQAASNEKTNSTSNNKNTAGVSSINNNNIVQNSNADNTAVNSSDNTLLVSAETEEEEENNSPLHERPAVTLDMEDVPILTADMLQMAKEQNIDLVLKMNGRAAWHVNVSESEGDFSNIDMNVLFQGGIIPKELLTDLAGENEYLEFNLTHDGSFGFDAELEIALNPEDRGRYANLFYYDSEKETLEFICAVIIDENGYARFPMEHASSYVIIVSDYSMADMPYRNASWNSMLRLILIGVFLLMVLAVVGYTVYFWRQKRQEDYDEEIDDEDDVEDIEYVDTEKNIAEIEEYEIDNKDFVSMSGTESEEQLSLQPPKPKEAIYTEAKFEEKTDADADMVDDADDWIEDQDWQEPEEQEGKDPYADDHAENDWIEDDEWDIGNDWMDDDEWEKKNHHV